MDSFSSARFCQKTKKGHKKGLVKSMKMVLTKKKKKNEKMIANDVKTLLNMKNKDYLTLKKRL